MSSNLTPIDISKMSDLLDLVEEMKTTKQPRELKRDNKIVAVLSPIFEDKKYRPRHNVDYQKSLAAIGSWNDLNADELIDNISRWRNKGSRPVIRP